MPIMKPDFSTLSNSNLRQWLVILAVMALFSIVIGYDLAYEYREAHSNAVDRLRGDARIIQDNLSKQLETASTVIADLIDDEKIWVENALSHLPADKRLADYQKVLPGISSISVLDQAGFIRHSSTIALIGKDLSSREYFQDAKSHRASHEVRVANPLLSLTGSRVIVLTRAKVDRSGQFRGVVAIALDSERVRNFV